MDDSHSRSGPAAAAGARDGAGGLGDVAAAATGSGDSPLPMEPGQEYVSKADHDSVTEQLTGERDAMLADLQRIAADFENYKRRAQREREQASAAAESRLLSELLTVIDDIERAIEHVAKDGAAIDAATDGLRTVHTRLTSVVGSHGLVRIEAGADLPFDANLHEAMMVQPAPNGQPDDMILQELQSGWMLGERVLRHARGIVSGGG